MSLDTENRNREALVKLRRDIKATRQNRINASGRLLSRERFVQSINIYYSCVAAIVTLFSLTDQSRAFGIASAMLTVILAISIVYLNAQKYGTRAQQFQTNYNALQSLLYEIDKELRRDDVGEIDRFTEQYIDLLQTSENHVHMDHLRSLYHQDKINARIAQSSGEKPPRKKLQGFEKCQFWSWQIGGFVLKCLFWLAPVAYFAYELLREMPT